MRRQQCQRRVRRSAISSTDELAQKLKVSEEYLSSQFKKETGMSFTETVRSYRIEKIKELLLHSKLKLNQISDMV